MTAKRKAKPAAVYVAPPAAPAIPAQRKSIFRSAVTGDDGSIDPGYLGLYAVMLTVLGAIPMTLILALVRLIIGRDHPLDLVGVAAVIASAGAAFGTAAGGVGLFRMGDKPHPNTQITSAQQTTTTVTQPAKGE
jgi:hypothetical protein